MRNGRRCRTTPPRSRLRRRGAPTLALSVLCLMATAPAAMAIAPSNSYTWQGASSSADTWSTAANWTATAPAASAAGAFSFPSLTASGASYGSDNDLTGLTATGLSIADNQAYQISGNALTLTPSAGSDGIVAAPDGTGSSVPSISNPLVLGAPQSWSITGNNFSGGGGLSLSGGLTGTGQALGVSIGDHGQLTLSGSNDVGPFSATGADASDGGSEGGDNGTLTLSGHSELNANSGSSVTASGLAVDLAPSSGGVVSTGTLSLTGDNVTIGANGSAGVVHVDGPATIDSGSYTDMVINGASDEAGVGYTQLSATGNVSLGGSLYLVTSTGACPTLTAGQPDVLIQAGNGQSLSGTFSNLANGAKTTIATDCGGPFGSDHEYPAVVNYTPTEMTVTPLDTSTTTIAASPTTGLVTNEPVTLTATVTPANSSDMTTGTVAFSDGDATINGCAAQSITPNMSGGFTTTCTTSFDASDSSDPAGPFGGASGQPEVSAAFTPGAGSTVASSSSDSGGGDLGLTVNPQGSTTGLAASSTSPAVGVSVTYTATVAPATFMTPTLPGSSVQFMDGTTAISCTDADDNQLSGTAPDQATCTTSYAGVGSHTITAVYSGDGNFSTSTSSPVAVMSVATPVAPTAPTGGGTATGTTTGGATTTSSGVAPVAPTAPSAPTGGGTATGGTTTGGSTTTSSPPVASPGSGAAKVGAVKTHGSSAVTTVGCAVGGASCTVTTEITTTTKITTEVHGHRKTVTRTVVLGHKTLTVASGHSRKVTVSLNATARARLARKHSLTTRLVVTRSTGGKTTKVASRSVTFQSKKARNHAKATRSARLA